MVINLKTSNKSTTYRRYCSRDRLKFGALGRRHPFEAEIHLERVGFNPRRPVSRPATTAGGANATVILCFNPRRPVSRPATHPAGAAAVGSAVSIHADRFPGRRPRAPSGGGARQGVSIHADRFPGRRPPDHPRAEPWLTRFNPRRPVSRPATRRGLGQRRLQRRFNPRRPVSRPATARNRVTQQVVTVSIHADRFPGRRRRPATFRP